MKKLLQKIQQDYKNCKDYGLRNGKMSMLMFLYHYSVIDADIKIFTDTLFKDYVSGLKTLLGNDLTFTQGYGGIIWAMTRLSEWGYIQAEMDQMFTNIDSAMRSYLATYPVPIYVQDFPLSPAIYFLKRFHKEQTVSQYNRQIALINLTDHAAWLLEAESYKQIGLERLPGRVMNTLVYFLNQMEQLAIYPTKVHRLQSHIDHYIGIADYTNWLDRQVCMYLKKAIMDPLSDKVSIRNDKQLIDLLEEIAWLSLVYEVDELFIQLTEKLGWTSNDIISLLEHSTDNLSGGTCSLIGLLILRTNNGIRRE